jgi:hypothetical protein
MLTGQIRQSFTSIAEITGERVKKIAFLNAVIEEGLRLSPPVPAILPRVVPLEGGFVCGHWLPGDVSRPSYCPV